MSNKLLKAENPSGYAELANSGLLLGYPVSIGGKDAREDNGIKYHSTIKYFDPQKDHPHQVHDLAQHLPLNPPDAKNTQIKFDKFKSRLGDDVYAVTLHGNSADKMKEHNGKFAGMGFPSTFEWTPHISVDKAQWDKLQSSGAKTAHEAGITFGPAELLKGPQTLKTYHHEPDTTDPKFPDLGDMTAKVNVPVTKMNKSEKDSLVPPPGKDTYKELSLHHGTKSPTDFQHFDMKHHASGFYPGIYTSSNPEETKKYGRPVKVGFKGHLFEIKDPKHAEQLHEHAGGGGSGHKLVQKLKAAGYHGIRRGSEHIIFDPEHAKIEKAENTVGQKPLMKPFLSEAQRRWGHTEAGKEALGGNAGVHEWDEATKGKKLPERVSKSELESFIKSLIKSDQTLSSKHGRALALSGKALKRYIEDNNSLKQAFKKSFGRK